MINTKRSSILSLLVCLSVLFTTYEANAIPFSISEAFIDSVSFSFTGSGFIQNRSSAFSRVDFLPLGIDEDSDTAFGTGFVFHETAASSANPHQQGSAVTTSDPSLFSFTRVSSEIAFSQAFQNLEFCALSEGIFTVGLNYRLHQELGVDTLEGLASKAMSEAGLRLFKLGTAINDIDQAYLLNLLTSFGNLSQTETGSLWVSLYFNPGEKGRFDYATTVQAEIRPVCEPSTILLLGLGIVGLVGLGRTKITKRNYKK